ncbi:N-acetylmuramoyl-L-alanine amidase [Gemmobacter aquarius]|uniref:N-acetylmuramoyl-L-alanine amidase n=1 Tax=Paragemmobacter aquarius TaxID=2169400 RepID=A0A2S0UKU2_9RHOB|nr:N-acetylmuramoyl-L-alanine amidase [Gemmobacter aquarius]AWB48415.1 N-acetylmuramoyl-L-alanine amidase [Gemmobacter aquarius]
MRGLLRLALLCAALLGALPVWAQDLSALARLDPAASSITGDADEVTVTLAISQPVPWRVRILDDPPRLVMDFREVDWSDAGRIARSGDAVTDLRAGVFRAGWSRLVLELSGPFTVQQAGMQTAGAARVTVRLAKASHGAFTAAAALPEPPEWALPEPSALPVVADESGGPLRVVLDPGHGGIDPGAERDGQSEASLMLSFARELKERMIREGDFAVTMTREEDVFVPLETRISIARAAGAQVFVSLHADAIAEGEATGATVYTLSDEASDEASRTLAERHDRDDLLSGVDLTRQDDLVATILMDMARTDTTPRIDRLAGALAAAIQAAGVKMHRHPIQQAGFSVLKSPDIPSVLLELGFLSSGSDLKRLNDPAWRDQMQGAIIAGLRDWHAADQALRKQ